MSRVFVLGNAMVDLALPMARLPLPGETVVADGLSRAPGGKGLNQAVVAARTGVDVFFQAQIGRDADAAFVRGSLEAEPFAGLHLLTCDAPTDLSIVMVAADAENSIVSLCQAADAMTIADAVGFVGLMQEADWLIVQGNLSLEVTAAAGATARSRGGYVLFNAAPLRWPLTTMLRHTNVLVVNRVEAARLTGDEDPAAAAGFLQAGGAGSVVVTLGQAGCLWLDTATHCRSAVATQAIDTTGAGDSFCGALVAALAGQVAFDIAIARAQAAACISVTRRGAFAALPSAAELRASRTSS
jgi:ribokinase